MPIFHFLEHQIAGSDYTLSGLSGSTTQSIETPNKILCGCQVVFNPFIHNVVKWPNIL